MRIMASRKIEATPARRATNVSLPAGLVEEAKARGINVSRSCEDGLEKAVRAQRKAEFVEEHREYFAFWNDWVEKNGIPLSQFRKF
jgi:antitoxin CcdA